MEEYTLKDFENNMTIYFYKRDGKIYNWQTGISNMSRFGNYAEDYSLIIDFVVLPKDDYFLNNYTNFYIDTKTKKLIFKMPTNLSYKIEK